MKCSSAFHRGGKVPGGRGSLTTNEPIWPHFISRFSESTTRTSHPGTGLLGEPAFTFKGSMPRQLAQIGHPVSVCHQLSITGTWRWLSAQCNVSGSQRSPAKNNVLKFERS